MPRLPFARTAFVVACIAAAATPALAVRIEGELFATTIRGSGDYASWRFRDDGYTDLNYPPVGLPLHFAFSIDAPAFPTTAVDGNPAVLSTLNFGFLDPVQWLESSQPPVPQFYSSPVLHLGTNFTEGRGDVQAGNGNQGELVYSYLLQSSGPASGSIHSSPASGAASLGIYWQLPEGAFPRGPLWSATPDHNEWTGTYFLYAQVGAPSGGFLPYTFERALLGSFRVDRLVVRSDQASIRSSGPVSPCMADPAALGCLMPTGLPGTTFAVASAVTVGHSDGPRGHLFIEGGAHMTAPLITVDRGGLLAVTGGLDQPSRLDLASALRVRDGEVQLVGGGQLRVDGAPPPPPPGGSFTSFASVALGYGGGKALLEVYGDGSELVVSQPGASLAVGTINSAEVAGTGRLRVAQLGKVSTPILEVGFNGGQGSVEVRDGSWVDVYNASATPVGARLFVGRGGGVGEVLIDGRAADGLRSLLTVRGPASQAVIGGYNSAAANFAGGGTGTLVARNGGALRVDNLLLVGSGPSGGLPVGKAVPQGELQVLSGARVEVLGYAEPAANRPALYAGVWGGSGKIVVDGDGSTLSVLGADPIVAIDAGMLDPALAGLGGLGRLEVRNGGLLQIGDADAGRLVVGVNGKVVVDDAIVSIAGGLEGRTDIYGKVELLNGSTFVSGLIEVHNGGYLCGTAFIAGDVKDAGRSPKLCPGSSPGQLAIEGSLVWKQGIIELEIEADGSGGFRTDSLLFVGVKDGDVDMAGAQLQFVFLGDTDPRMFAASELNTPEAFFMMQTDDGPVGLDALTPWATLFAGSTVSARAERFDITSFEYDVEAGFTSIQAVPVPEPGTLVLALLGGLAVAFKVRHRAGETWLLKGADKA